MRSASLLATLAVAAFTGTVVGQTGETPACSAGSPGGHFPAYLTDSNSKLKSEIPAIHGIKFTDGQPESVLGPAGTILSGLLPRIPNLVADEQLSQLNLALPYYSNSTTVDQAGGGSRGRYAVPSGGTDSHALEGEDLDKAIHDMLAAKPQRTTFSYRLHPSQDPKLGTIVEEFRTDSSNASVDIGSTGPGSPHGIGFSNSWIMFARANQNQMKFRYLGRQKMDGQDTVAIAFAQIPGLVVLPAEIGSRGVSCPYYTQGVIWVDASNQIVRLETDLLAPVPSIHLTAMRSDLHFVEVKIPERNLAFRMPSEVEISWQTSTNAGGELHRYSNYRLFTATSKIITKLPE